MRIARLRSLALRRGLASRSPAPSRTMNSPVLVKEGRPKPEFMTPLVEPLRRSRACRSQRRARLLRGAPKKLTNTDGLARYYRALAAASPRVKVFEAGLTDEGRQCLVIAVADENTIPQSRYLQGISGKLADPRGLTDAGAKTIIAQAKPIYFFFGGLHSAENRTAGDAHGAGVSHRYGGFAADRADPQQRDLS